ncbi:MAG: STAS domain-containing protein [Candidatus Gracilibacteria bacterium]
MAEANIVVEELPSKEPNSKAVLLTVSGQLDESNVDDKAKEVYKVFEDNPGKLSLIFDFAGLEYMNSKSIGYLTDWYGKIKEKGGELIIARTKPNITDILQVVGLTQLIKTYESLDEAKQALSTAASTAASAAAPAPTPATTATTPATAATPAETPKTNDETYQINQ